MNVKTWKSHPTFHYVPGKRGVREGHSAGYPKYPKHLRAFIPKKNEKDLPAEKNIGYICPYSIDFKLLR